MSIVPRAGTYERNPDGKHSGWPRYDLGYVPKMAPDAVVSHASALHAWHCARSMTCSWMIYSATKPKRRWRLPSNRVLFVGTPYARGMRAAGQAQFDVADESDSGAPCRVTGLARTFLDCLRNPGLGGGWESIWFSYGLIGGSYELEGDTIVAYARWIGSPLLAARMGFLMESNRAWHPCADRTLDALQAMSPTRPTWMSAGCREIDPRRVEFMERWNIIVPRWIRESIDEPWS